MLDKNSINWKTIILGLLLNILVIAVFLSLYHAYIVRPQIETAFYPAEVPGMEEMAP